MRIEVYIVQLVLTFLLVFVFPILLFAGDLSVTQKPSTIEVSEKSQAQLSSTQSVIKGKKYTLLTESQSRETGAEYVK